MRAGKGCNAICDGGSPFRAATIRAETRTGQTCSPQMSRRMAGGQKIRVFYRHVSTTASRGRTDTSYFHSARLDTCWIVRQYGHSKGSP